jgi:hypothetical protein
MPAFDCRKLRPKEGELKRSLSNAMVHYWLSDLVPRSYYWLQLTSMPYALQVVADLHCLVAGPIGQTARATFEHLERTIEEAGNGGTWCTKSNRRSNYVQGG